MPCLVKKRFIKTNTDNKNKHEPKKILIEILKFVYMSIFTYFPY